MDTITATQSAPFAATQVADRSATHPGADAVRYYRPPDTAIQPATQPSHGRYPPAVNAKEQASHARAGSGGLPSGIAVETICRNIVVCTSASGGIGLSVCAAAIARRLAQRDPPCALADLDFDAGGLDVLLGIEREPGIRFETLDAPLGRLDGEALNRDLPEWDGVRVLASDPWNGESPDWWQTQAAVRALAEANRVLVVDAGRGDLLDTMPELGEGAQLVVVELSVLGLARAKRHLERLDQRVRANVPAGGGLAAAERSRPLLVGVEPRGSYRRAGVVSLAETADYLGNPVSARIRADPKLCSDVLSGLGIRAFDRANRRAIDGLCDRIDGLLSGGSAA